MSNYNYTAIVLAAGKSKRMGGIYPKAIIKLRKKPIITYIIDNLQKTPVSDIIVVIGFKGEMVHEVLKRYNLKYAVQNEQLGTGHAVKIAIDSYPDITGDILVMCGDTPFIQPETIQNLNRYHKSENAGITILTTILENPDKYGRIIRNDEGDIEAIVEFKDATESERKIKEINSGLYIFDSDILLQFLPMLNANNVQKEYYLTDIVRLAMENGYKVSGYICPDPIEISGINSPDDFKNAEKYIQSFVN